MAELEKVPPLASSSLTRLSFAFTTLLVMHLSAKSALALAENDAVKTIELGAGTGLVCTFFSPPQVCFDACVKGPFMKSEFFTDFLSSLLALSLSLPPWQAGLFAAGLGAEVFPFAPIPAPDFSVDLHSLFFLQCRLF